MATFLLITSGTKAGERLTTDAGIELGRDVQGAGRAWPTTRCSHDVTPA